MVEQPAVRHGRRRDVCRRYRRRRRARDDAVVVAQRLQRFRVLQRVVLLVALVVGELDVEQGDALFRNLARRLGNFVEEPVQLSAGFDDLSGECKAMASKNIRKQLKKNKKAPAGAINVTRLIIPTKQDLKLFVHLYLF